MLVVFFIIFSLLGLFFPKSRWVSVMIFVFVWILMWNESMLDMINYMRSYENENAGDFGYKMLTTISKKIGANFIQFKLSLTFCGLAFYLWFILKFAYYKGLVSSIYLVAYSILDVEQFRNFVSFSVLLLFIPQLFNRRPKNIIKYCLGVVLASLIHMSSLFYSLNAIISKNSLKSSKNKWILLTVVMLVFIALSQAEVLYRIERHADFSGDGTSNFTRVLLVAMFSFNMFYIYVNSKNIISKRLNKNQYLIAADKDNTILYMNAVLFFLLPFIFQSLNFARLYRYMGIINCIYVSNRFVAYKGFNLVFRFLILFIYMATYAVLAWVMHQTSLPISIYNVFNYNLLIK